MAGSQPFQVVEIDVDYCSRTYGTAPCTAVLSSVNPDKCFNTYFTCQDKPNFLKSTKTLKYCNNRMNVPLGLGAYPVLESVSTFTSTVNIAGANESQGAFGRRGTVVARLKDLPDDDVLFDKYVTERTTGAAVFGGVGYKPVDFGTHFTKLKARFPYYANRAMRVVDGVLENDVFVVEKTRHFITTNFKGPDDNGNFEIEGKDVLSLADDKKALVPRPSRGKLKSVITAAVGQTFDLEPSGIGVEYDTSGYAVIGSEVVTFTRSVDTITLTGRGLEGTVAAARNINDAFQQSKKLDNVRVDDFIYDLLVNFAGVPVSYCPIVAEWEPLITRWMSSTRLTTTITKPTGVAQILGELAALGISIWWDDVQQQILILPNVPVTDEAITDISDDYNIVNIKQDDREEDRLTQVHFYSKQTDPTKDVKDKSNYDQVQVIIDGTAEGPNAYDDTRVKEVFCRFFNNGAEAAIRVAGLRLLKRFNTSPIHYTIKLDNRDDALSLTDVLRLNTRVLTSATGRVNQKLLQVFRKAETNAEGQFEVSAQAYNFDGRFGYCMPNGSSDYASATALEKATGNYAVDGTLLLFPDGTVPYEAI